MVEEAKIAFYKIDQCGYFARGKDEPEFGDVRTALEQLMRWAHQPGMTLAETQTYEPEDGDTLPAYCFDIVRHNASNSILLTTWNEVPNTDGAIAAVNGRGTVGGARVSFTNVPRGAIPGFATYFWFIPDRQLFATVRFQHRQNGHLAMKTYLAEFMSKFSDYAVVDSSGEEDAIHGYRAAPGEKIKPLWPKFKTSRYRKPGAIDYVRNKRATIRKIIKKNSLSADVAPDLDLWQQLLTTFGIAEPAGQDFDDIHVRYEVPYSPSEEELEEIIGHWESDDMHTRWDDIGFLLQGEPDPYWLSHSLAKDTIELNVARQNDEIVPAQSLLSQLYRNRDRLFSILD